MSAFAFDDRVAKLEEHLVRPSPEDSLRRAEELLARGDHSGALLALSTAKHRRFLDELRKRDNDA
jgi:hypothetical protein